MIWVHVEGDAPAEAVQVYPYSTLQFELQPSPGAVLPSSQVSYEVAPTAGSRSTTPFPHCTGPLRQHLDATAGSGTEQVQSFSTPQVEEHLEGEGGDFFFF